MKCVVLISYLTIQLLHQKLRLIRLRKHFPTFCCSPSAFRFGVLCVQSSSSASVILLHTLSKTSGYLSYCYLLISSRQCGHSPLTSCINKIFLPKELQIPEYFCLFWTGFCILWLCRNHVQCLQIRRLRYTQTTLWGTSNHIKVGYVTFLRSVDRSVWTLACNHLHNYMYWVSAIWYSHQIFALTSS